MKITLSLNPETIVRLRKIAETKYGIKGALSLIVEEALRIHLDKLEKEMEE